MINENKWTNTVQGIQKKQTSSKYTLDTTRWVNTIPKKNSFNPSTKYSLISFLFVFGLILVSVVKNETKNLEKEINKLNKKIYLTQFNLDQSILDHEVITSPDNISILATEYLNVNLVPYKKSQIEKLDKEIKIVSEKKGGTKYVKKVEVLSKNIKFKLGQNVKKKKLKMLKLQELYSNPKALPTEIKRKAIKEIKKKKTELLDIYHSPKKSINLKKVGKWTGIQVVKAFFGMPIFPGR